LALRTAVLHRNAESFCPGNTPWIVRVLPVVTWTAERHPARTALTRFIPPERIGKGQQRQCDERERNRPSADFDKKSSNPGAEYSFE
jgi:hypothetical protein